jgi:NAD(P)-dependent dehydrogenase (short-subunit alcohol dehydrogenase family)
MKSKLFDLSGRVVVITGAAGLLGRQHADAVASVGGIPVLLDLKAEAIENLTRELNAQYGVSAQGYVVDITRESEIEANTSQLLKCFGKIDVLVNNAANNPKVENQDEVNFSRLENFTLDMWQDDIAVGLTGAFLCAKHYGTAISRNSKGGVILNISSDLGLISPDQRLYHQPGLSEEQQPVKPVTYSVVKTGLIGLTRYLATYWPNKVRCNSISPGGIYVNQGEEFVRRLSQLIPVGRMASKDEYKAAVAFLVSDASSYMNGANLVMDGGRSVW